MCGEDAGSTCGGEEEGLGRVTESVRSEGVKIKRCTLNTHSIYVGLPLGVVFFPLDKSTIYISRFSFSVGLLRVRRYSSSYCSTSSIVTRDIPGTPERRHVIRSSTRFVFQLLFRDQSKYAVIETKLKYEIGYALSEGLMTSRDPTKCVLPHAAWETSWSPREQDPLLYVPDLFE